MKKIWALMTGAVLTIGGVTVLPSVATAHTGDISINYECNVETGEYNGEVYLTTNNTNAEGKTLWRIGTSGFEGTPTSVAKMDRGPVYTTGAQTVKLGDVVLPGTTTGNGPWVYAYTTWGTGFSQGSDGQSWDILDGSCKVEEVVPPFNGVEKYVPTYISTCEGYSFSHPEFRRSRDQSIANIYGYRYGVSQSDAQSKEFTNYIPGTTVSVNFDDSYISNSFYFEFKVGYDGLNLTHQIGQTRGKSEACDRPIPNKPDELRGENTSYSDPVCVIPLDGTAEVVTSGRTWVDPLVFDENLWEWVKSDRVYTDWVTVSVDRVDREECEPEVVVPPVIDTPVEKIDDISNEVIEEPNKENHVLANTGSDSNWIAYVFVFGLIAVGVGLMVRKRN